MDTTAITALHQQLVDHVRGRWGQYADVSLCTVRPGSWVAKAYPPSGDVTTPIEGAHSGSPLTALQTLGRALGFITVTGAIEPAAMVRHDLAVICADYLHSKSIAKAVRAAERAEDWGDIVDDLRALAHGEMDRYQHEAALGAAAAMRDGNVTEAMEALAALTGETVAEWAASVARDMGGTKAEGS